MSKEIELLMELAATHGVAAASVDDGTIIVFSRTRLVELLAVIDAKESDRAIVFVKRGARSIMVPEVLN